MKRSEQYKKLTKEQKIEYWEKEADRMLNEVNELHELADKMEKWGFDTSDVLQLASDILDDAIECEEMIDYLNEHDE